MPLPSLCVPMLIKHETCPAFAQSITAESTSDVLDRSPGARAAGLERNRARPSSAAIVEKPGPDAGCCFSPPRSASAKKSRAPRVGWCRFAVFSGDIRFSPEGGVKSGVPVWRRGVAGGGTEPVPKSVWNTPPTASPVASLNPSLLGSQQDMSGNRKELLLG